MIQNNISDDNQYLDKEMYCFLLYEIKLVYEILKLES